MTFSGVVRNTVALRPRGDLHASRPALVNFFAVVSLQEILWTDCCLESTAGPATPRFVL